MGYYDNVLQFKGTFRTYQDRVLTRAEEYRKDGKIHIVAAPGSGKTTLGIELIRRFGVPCLILSPSITIRQQWISRMTEGFLTEAQKPEDWFSNDIRRPKAVTAITYQALHSCMKQYAGVLKDEAAEDEEGAGPTEQGLLEPSAETVDFSGFDLKKAVREAGFGCLCLDEAHHLRSEWWKALEDFRKEFPDLKLIALTATPPYDSTPTQWKRYIDLCGPIDEEIFTPELVREGSLCPHQDYIYFNRPSREEKEAVREYTRRSQELFAELSSDQEFIRLIASHRDILAPRQCSEQLLDNPKYFSSILIFLHAAGVPFSPYLKELTGTKARLPKLTAAWMEVLLQGFLYEDKDSYPCDDACREQLIQRLKAAGYIQRKKVCLTKNEEISRLLMKSRGKLQSICRIVQSEYENLGASLRLLILCDFIKKESLSSLERETGSSGEIGAVPIFKYLYQQQPDGPRLGILSGSVVVIPKEAKGELLELFSRYGLAGDTVPLGETGYSQVHVQGSSHSLVAVITELFSRGRIQTLIGTKSLLGEGWDSPCINTLILATYVGSFMLSNQMRGRAIRTYAPDPNKVSNIWHLACVAPAAPDSGRETEGDYETLVRRFDTFLGVSCKEDLIETGIDRMDLPKKLTSPRALEAANEQALLRAADREGLRQTWAKSLKEIRGEMRVEEVESVDKDALGPGFLFVNALILSIGSLILFLLWMLTRLFLQVSVSTFDPRALTGFLLFFGLLFLFGKYGYRILTLCTPQRRMKKAAEGVLKALAVSGRLEQPEHCAIGTLEDDVLVAAYLKGGSTRDKTLFASCLAELFAPIDNPRYLLIPRAGRRIGNDTFPVPEIFGKRKEDVQLFARCMEKYLGGCRAVYTRVPEGRRILLKARTRSFFNQNERILCGKKVVRGDFE